MDAKKTSFGVLAVIIGLIAIFYIVGGTADTLLESSSTIEHLDNCSEYNYNGSPMVYNSTDYYCYATNGTRAVETADTGLPISNLFGGSGIIMIVMMIGLLITVIVLSFKMMRR